MQKTHSADSFFSWSDDGLSRGRWPDAGGIATPIWMKSANLIDYPTALTMMDGAVERIIDGTGPEIVWLLEHPPIFTAGTSAKPADLFNPHHFPTYDAGRGGQYTYHGPGQRIIYVMLDLRERGKDVRAFVGKIEQWVAASLADLGVICGPREGRIGLWVDRPEKGEAYEDKIAAIGLRLRRWVSFHGISINVDPDLSHFSGIVPCGIDDPLYGVTSLKDLGRTYKMADNMAALDEALKAQFPNFFG